MDNFLPPEEKSIFYKDSKKNPVTPEGSSKQLNEGGQQKKSQSFNRPQLPSSRILEPTPNAQSLVFAIISLPFSICRTWWFGLGWIWGLGTVTGIILASVAVYLANGGIQMVATSPDVFSEKDLEKLKMARILGIVSLCICAVSFVLLIYYYTIYG